MKLCSFLSVSLMAALLAHAAFAQQPTAEAAAENISTAQGPFVPQDVPMVRQGTRPEITLTARVQRVVFVKSQAADAKTAIANLLLSDAGLSLITMALAPQMRMWNPYMNDGIRKGVDLGKGMLVGHGSDTKGFEFDTLQGDTADSTLTEGTAEFLLPVKNYLPAPDFDLSTIQPVLLKLEARERDHARLLTSRQVELKQNKTGRFDMKPTVERLETRVDQNCVPVRVDRLPESVFKVVPLEPLLAGEYAIVFRTASPSGSNTQNVALKPAAQPAPASGLADSTPAGPNSRPASSMSPFGRLRGGFKPAATAGAPVVQPGMAGFIAWDFRVSAVGARTAEAPAGGSPRAR